MHQPCEGHWTAAKRVLKYLKGTQSYGIKYSKVSDFHLIGYSDSDFDGDKEHGVYFRLFDESWINSHHLEIMKAISSC
jgi:hypothetical protein